MIYKMYIHMYMFVSYTITCDITILISMNCSLMCYVLCLNMMNWWVKLIWVLENWQCWVSDQRMVGLIQGDYIWPDMNRRDLYCQPQIYNVTFIPAVQGLRLYPVDRWVQLIAITCDVAFKFQFKLLSSLQHSNLIIRECSRTCF